MVVMTAKVNKKRILLVLGALIALIVLLCMITGGKEDSAQAEPVSLRTNDARVQYLEDCGWDVVVSPVKTQQVLIPTDSSEVFGRYNALQISQGFDLTKYAGKTVMQYVYEIENYPNASDPVYATLLLYDNRVIGGDVTDTSAGGVVQGLRQQD